VPAIRRLSVHVLRVMFSPSYSLHSRDSLAGMVQLFGIA
jgi:hypothetical protein